MKRRDFIARIAGGVTPTSLVQLGHEAGAIARRRPSPHSLGLPTVRKLSRIGVSTWSFHNYFQTTRDEQVSLPGTKLALLDFPEMIADQYHTHNLEFVAPHFASTESAYLQELKSHLVRAHSHLVNIPVDIAEL